MRRGVARASSRQHHHFRKIGNNVQLIARNFNTRDPPAIIATADGTVTASPRYIASARRKESVLVEANALLTGDIPMMPTLVIVPRSYSLDAPTRTSARPALATMPRLM
jgi:hypothetical protein